MAESLNAYSERLETALANNKPYSAYNKDMAHAKVVVCTSMAHAKSEVLLLSERLDPILYASGWFWTAVTGFLEGGGKLRVLVESDIPVEHPVRHLATQNGGVEIRRVTEGVAYDFNFMLIDNIGYRFEADRREPRAVVSFHEQTEGPRNMLARTKEVFEMLWERFSGPLD